MSKLTNTATAITNTVQTKGGIAMKSITIHIDNIESILGSMDDFTELIIPSVVTIDGDKYQVTGIGPYLFKECTSLQSVVIPEGVTKIGDCAFSECKALTEVNIPSTVTSIGNYAFYGCTGLTSVYYNGTEEQWSAITIKEGNDVLTDPTSVVPSINIIYKSEVKKDQNLKEIAKQIEELCNNSGLDYFFAVSDSKEIISSIGAGNHRSEKLEDLRSYWVNTYLKYSSITFLDLYNLIQEAERNEFGFHVPFNDDDSVSFHIYSGKRQMNLNIVDKSTIGFDGISHFESVLNFIFDPTNETVRIVKVKDGVADYFNYLELNWHSSINNEKFLTYISDVETYGCSVKDIIYKSIIQSLGKEMI